MLAALLALPVVPLWSYSQTTAMLAVGAFLMGACTQGAWANVPAYLNELSPPAVRAMFPGLVYQLGNLLSSRVTVFQAGVAESRGDDYAFALASVTLAAALMLAVWVRFGPEKPGELG
ncbi:MAG: MFS transporter [Novosphingobium sp.]